MELRGLSRQLTVRNLGIPRVVLAAVRVIRTELVARRVRALLGMGGYVTVPAGLAARRAGIPVAVAEQNAEAGLANRIVSRFATRVFGSFPTTHRLPRAEWVGNPIRRSLADFDRDRLRPDALRRFGLEPDVPVLGVFGGSLGAGVINRAVMAMLETWDGPAIQVLHLAGQGHDEVAAAASVPSPMGGADFITEMEGSSPPAPGRPGRRPVAELTATATPRCSSPAASVGPPGPVAAPRTPGGGRRTPRTARRAPAVVKASSATPRRAGAWPRPPRRSPNPTAMVNARA